MSIRTIRYSVTENGINPVSRQFGGIQGEHNVTKVIFELSDELHAKIWEHMYSQGAKIVYRFDGIDGVGGKISTDTAEIGFEDSAPGGVRSFEYLLSHDITKEGGTVQVFLIITSILNDETQAELYNFPATLYLKDKIDGISRDNEDYESVSTLAENAKGAAQRAEDSAEEAQQSAEAAEIAQQKTEESIMALEAGSTIIFQGGNASSRFTVDIAVDDELSKASENPVQNRKVFERFEEQDKTYDDLAAQIASLANFVNMSLAQAKLDAHPIGSIYISENNTSPAELFGGTWERIKDAFIWATGDTESITYTRNGETVTEYLAAGFRGGEATHTLTVNEMPKHTHAVYNENAHGEPITWAVEFKSASNGIASALQTSSNGGNLPHNNMPPYLAAYMWKRIA